MQSQAVFGWADPWPASQNGPRPYGTQTIEVAQAPEQLSQRRPHESFSALVPPVSCGSKQTDNTRISWTPSPTSPSRAAAARHCARDPAGGSRGLVACSAMASPPPALEILGILTHPLSLLDAFCPLISRVWAPPVWRNAPTAQFASPTAARCGLARHTRRAPPLRRRDSQRRRAAPPLSPPTVPASWRLWHRPRPPSTTAAHSPLSSASSSRVSSPPRCRPRGRICRPSRSHPRRRRRMSRSGTSTQLLLSTSTTRRACLRPPGSCYFCFRDTHKLCCLHSLCFIMSFSVLLLLFFLISRIVTPDLAHEHCMGDSGRRSLVNYI